MAEFAIDGIRYQSKMMDGEVQTLVLKRLLPAFAILMSCQPALAAIKAAKADATAGEDAPEPDASDDGAEAIKDALLPLARELAAMREEDFTYILHACMDVTMRNQQVGVGWAPVRQKGLIQMAPDKRPKVQLTIVGHVLAENFSEIMASFGVDVADLAVAAKPAR